MTYASATASGRRQFQRNSNSVSFADSASKIGPISNFVVLLLLACLLAVVYLSQVTKTSSYSYTLDNLKSQQTELKEEFAALEIETAKVKSVESARNSTAAQSLVTPVDVSYIN